MHVVSDWDIHQSLSLFSLSSFFEKKIGIMSNKVRKLLLLQVGLSRVASCTFFHKLLQWIPLLFFGPTHVLKRIHFCSLPDSGSLRCKTSRKYSLSLRKMKIQGKLWVNETCEYQHVKIRNAYVWACPIRYGQFVETIVEAKTPFLWWGYLLTKH